MQFVQVDDREGQMHPPHTPLLWSIGEAAFARGSRSRVQFRPNGKLRRSTKSTTRKNEVRRDRFIRLRPIEPAQLRYAGAGLADAVSGSRTDNLVCPVCRISDGSVAGRTEGPPNENHFRRYDIFRPAGRSPPVLCERREGTRLPAAGAQLRDRENAVAVGGCGPTWACSRCGGCQACRVVVELVVVSSGLSCRRGCVAGCTTGRLRPTSRARRRRLWNCRARHFE